VVYAVVKHPVFDPEQRVNSFAHVNYTPEKPLNGVLLCINGAGSLYRWIRENVNINALTYSEMEARAAFIPIGSDQLCILPFGNGAERMLGNQNSGAQIIGLQFNRHDQRHFFRAALEGIAFAFVYGMEAMRELGIPIRSLRVGNDNLFQSDIFSDTMATLLDVDLEVYSTNGAIGSAKAAGVSVGIFQSPEAAMEQNLSPLKRYKPSTGKFSEYSMAYSRWKGYLS
jgi:xylulokinase